VGGNTSLTSQIRDEPAEVEDLYVGVIIRGTSIDITSLLNDKQRTHFEDLCLEEAEFAQEEGSL